MSMGLKRADLESELRPVLKALGEQRAQDVIDAVVTMVDKNNREIEREIGKKFADIERAIGRR